MDINYNKMFNDRDISLRSRRKVPSEQPYNKNQNLISKEIHAVVTNCTRLNVREKPSKESKVIFILNNGDIVDINQVPYEDDTDKWAPIKFYATPGKDEQMTTGFVMAEFIKEA